MGRGAHRDCLDAVEGSGGHYKDSATTQGITDCPIRLCRYCLHVRAKARASAFYAAGLHGLGPGHGLRVTVRHWSGARGLLRAPRRWIGRKRSWLDESRSNVTSATGHRDSVTVPTDTRRSSTSYVVNISALCEKTRVMMEKAGPIERHNCPSRYYARAKLIVIVPRGNGTRGQNMISL